MAPRSQKKQPTTEIWNYKPTPQVIDKQAKDFANINFASKVSFNNRIANVDIIDSRKNQGFEELVEFMQSLYKIAIFGLDEHFILLEMASDEQRKADQGVMKLAEDQKKEKEDLHKKIILLEKQLDAKQAAEVEIERLKGQLNVMKHIGEDDKEVLKKVEEIHHTLRERKEELDDLESLNQTLVVHILSAFITGDRIDYS